MTPRKLHQQALYLEPDRAELLDELAAETRIPKAVLLREAVEELLAKYEKVASESHQQVRDALIKGQHIAERYAKMTNEQLWIGKCKKAIDAIDVALETLRPMRRGR